MENKNILKNCYIMSLDSIFNESALCFSHKTGLPYIKDFQPKENDFYFVFGGHKYPLELLSKQHELNYNFTYIILNSESQLSDVMRNKFYIDLMKKNIVFNYSCSVADYLLETHEIKNYSYFFFDFIHNQIETEKKYDYTFIGSYSVHRQEIINQLKSSYPHKRFYIDFEWKNKIPMELKKVLKESEYVLNIPYYLNDNNLETHRINNALSCDCQVVSFKSGNEDTDKFYEDYIYFTDNLNDFFKCHEIKKKKSYTELIRGLSMKWNTHNLFILKKLIETLKQV